MSALQALDTARAVGIEVRLDGKDLMLAGVGDPPAEVLDMLRRHKLSIVGLLQQHAGTVSIEPWDSADWQAYFDERAAIEEFDGGLVRGDAEARAYVWCVGEWLHRNATCSSRVHCVHCGRAESTSDLLLPVGLAGAGLHRDCVSPWHAARTAAGVRALKAMGIALNVAINPQLVDRWFPPH
jgi:hypothetical protein